MLPFFLAGRNPATNALVSAMTTTPSGERVGLINQTIMGLVSAGLWDKLDVLYMLAAHDEQAGRLNWKNPGTFTLTANNSPTFTVDRGFQGDGATSDLSSTYNPSTFGGAYTLNSAMMGEYTRVANTVASAADMSMSSVGRIASNAGLTGQIMRVNDATVGNMGSIPQAGHFVARRPSAVGRDAWRNGIQTAVMDAVASTTIATAFRLLSLGGGGFANAQLSFAYASGAMTDAEMVQCDAALRLGYLVGVGAA